MWYFNPRAPYGARHLQRIPCTAQRYFNPRAPYGARLLAIAPRVWYNTRISIHAPHTGRDSVHILQQRPGYGFQSTRPIRGATRGAKPRRSVRGDFNPRAPYGARRHFAVPPKLCMLHFNPRAPYGARREVLCISRGATVISIHAPHTGRDYVLLWLQYLHIHFNPRAPYGARLLPDAVLRAAIAGFQSTRPIRGAT